MARNDLLCSFLQALTFLVFTNADSHGNFVNNCVEFHRVLVQQYASTLETDSLGQNYSTRSPNESQHLSPFGTFPRDWTRLILLRDALPQDSTIRNNFKHLFTILLVAHDQASKTNCSSQHLVPAPKINDTIVKKNSISSSAPILTSEAVGKNLTSPREKARKIIPHTSFDLVVTKIPFIGKKESGIPEHFPDSNEHSPKSTNDETLCNRSSTAQDFVQPFRNNRSGSMEKGKFHQFNSPENEKSHSPQSSTSMNLRATTLIPEQKTAQETLQDSRTSRSFPFETISSDEFSISSKQENDGRDSTHFSEEFSSPRTFTNNQNIPHQFLTITRNSQMSGSTDQQLGTSSWTEYSIETEEFAKISSSTSTPPISISAPSEGLATEEEQVQKYPWEMVNNSLSKIKPIKSNQSRAKEEKMQKPNDVNSSPKLKTDSNNLKASGFNQTKTGNTPEVYNRHGEDCKSRRQEFSSVLQTEQTKMTGNSWTTIFPNERGSMILETSDKNDEIKTTNFSDRMENSYSAKSISNKSKLRTESSIFTDNEKNVEDAQSPNYGEEIIIPQEVSSHSSIRNEPETDSSSNNSPSSSPENPKANETPLRDKNSTERRDYGVEHGIENTVTVTMPSETSSPLIPRELKESSTKSAVGPNLSRNDEISRNYKHDIKDFGAARKNLEARPRSVYEFGVSAKNRSFWRQKLEASEMRRVESRKGNPKPINVDEKSSNGTKSNVPITKESNDSSGSPTHGRINELRPRKQDSQNGDIEQRFSWFYRQGQTEDRSKSRLKQNEKTKIKVRCKNPRD